MKPLGNNMSFIKYILLLILFSLPVIGTPALLICAIFSSNPGTRGFARGILIFYLIIYALLIIGMYLGIVQLEPDFMGGNDPVEVFRAVKSVFA